MTDETIKELKKIRNGFLLAPILIYSDLTGKFEIFCDAKGSLVFEMIHLSYAIRQLNSNKLIGKLENRERKFSHFDFSHKNFTSMFVSELLKSKLKIKKIIMAQLITALIY